MRIPERSRGRFTRSLVTGALFLDRGVDPRFLNRSLRRGEMDRPTCPPTYVAPPRLSENLLSREKKKGPFSSLLSREKRRPRRLYDSMRSVHAVERRDSEILERRGIKDGWTNSITTRYTFVTSRRNEG